MSYVIVAAVSAVAGVVFGFSVAILCVAAKSYDDTYLVEETEYTPVSAADKNKGERSC